MRKMIAVFNVLLVTMALAQTAGAQNKKARAAKYFDRAVSAYENHEYKEALEAFESAYEMVPHWRVLAHIGTCYAKLNRPVRAINALERYLEEGGAKISVEERRAALDMLEDQRGKVGTLHLHVAPRGTEVTIDGDSVGRAPFQKILLLSGPHHIIIIDGSKVVERDIRIVPREEVVVRYPEQSEEAAPVGPIAPTSESLPSAAAQDASGAPEAGEDGRIGLDITAGDPGMGDGIDGDSGSKSSVPVFIALGVAGAGAIVGAIGWGFFIDNKISVRNYEDELKRDVYQDGQGEHFMYEDDCVLTSKNGDSVYSIPDSPWAEKQGLYCMSEFERREYEDNARTALIPAVLGTSLAVVGGMTALVFAFNPEWFRSDDDEKGSDALILTPVTGPGYAGMSFSGRF